MSRLNLGALLIGLLPFAWLVYALFIGGLGPNPVETLTRVSGEWALRFLLLSLACTPLRRLGWALPMRLRRQWGLLALFYALLHLGIYLLLEHELQLAALFDDLRERPYITLGMLSVVLLVPLGITSTRHWQRRLGRHWRQLHRLVYPAAVMAVAHFYLLVKADTREPLIHAFILTLLFVLRLTPPLSRRQNARPQRPRRAPPDLE